MKSILKTIPYESNLNYNEIFASLTNVEIQRKLVLELRKALKPKFNPTHNQVIKWLMSLYKSRRSRNNYKKREDSIVITDVYMQIDK